MKRMLGIFKKKDAPKVKENKSGEIIDSVKPVSYNSLREFINENVDIGSEDLKSFHIVSGSEEYVMFFDGENLITVESNTLRFKDFIEKMYGESFDVEYHEKMASLYDYIAILEKEPVDNHELIGEAFIKYIFAQLRHLDTLLKTGVEFKPVLDIHDINISGLTHYDFVDMFYEQEKALQHILNVLKIEEINDSITLKQEREYEPTSLAEQRVLQVARDNGGIESLYYDYRFMPVELFAVVNDLDREGYITIQGLPEQEAMPDLNIMGDAIVNEPDLSVSEEEAPVREEGMIESVFNLDEDVEKPEHDTLGVEPSSLVEDNVFNRDSILDAFPVLSQLHDYDEYKNISKYIHIDDEYTKEVNLVQDGIIQRLAHLKDNSTQYLQEFRDNEDRHAVKNLYEEIIKNKNNIEEQLVNTELYYALTRKEENLIDAIHQGDFSENLAVALVNSLHDVRDRKTQLGTITPTLDLPVVTREELRGDKYKFDDIDDVSVDSLNVKPEIFNVLVQKYGNPL